MGGAATDAQGARRGRLAAALGGTSAILFVLVMAAGADRPPPPGFLLVIGYGLLLALAVWRVLPRLLAFWDARGAGPATLRAGIAGFVAGLLLWGLTVVISSGEPSVEVDAASRLIGAAVVGVLGALGSVLLATFGRLLDRRQTRGA